VDNIRREDPLQLVFHCFRSCACLWTLLGLRGSSRTHRAPLLGLACTNQTKRVPDLFPLFHYATRKDPGDGSSTAAQAGVNKMSSECSAQRKPFVSPQR